MYLTFSKGAQLWCGLHSCQSSFELSPPICQGPGLFSNLTLPHFPDSRLPQLTSSVCTWWYHRSHRTKTTQARYYSLTFLYLVHHMLVNLAHALYCQLSELHQPKGFFQLQFHTLHSVLQPVSTYGSPARTCCCLRTNSVELISSV